MFFGIQDDGKSPEKFCEFRTTSPTVLLETTIFGLNYLVYLEHIIMCISD
jgi:hypothetical protein